MSLVAPMVGQHFAYASGRTGVLQQTLLTESDRDRLLGAKDLKEAEAILTELKLTNPIDQGLRSSTEILNALDAWVRKEVEQMAPKSKLPIFSILWMENDIPLIAYALKKHGNLTSTVSVPPSDTTTSYTLAQLQFFLIDGKGDLPEHLDTFLTKMSAFALEGTTPKFIDAQVTQYICDQQIKLARSSKSKLIKEFVRHKIDIVNIRTAIRLLQEEEPTIDHLIMGGYIDCKKLTEDLPSILRAVDASPLSYDLSENIRKAVNDTNALERALSDVLAKDIAQMWNIPLSVEPVFAFAALTASQLKLLRALLIGKRAGMSPQEIKQVLPPFLSAYHYLV